MTPQGGDIRCTRLGNDTFIFFSRLLVPPIAVRQVPVCSGAYLILNICKRLWFFIFWYRWCGYRARSPDDTAERCHPMNAIGRRYFNFFSQLLVPPIAVTQVPVCSGAYLILNICKRSVFYFRNGRCGYRDLVTDIRGIFKNFVYKY